MHPDKEELLRDIDKLYAKHSIAGSPFDDPFKVLCSIIEENKGYHLPDLSDKSPIQIRELKKKVRIANKKGRKTYNGYDIELVKQAIYLRAKELGIGKSGVGRPAKPLQFWWD